MTDDSEWSVPVRREVLSALGLTATTSIAGCSTIRSYLSTGANSTDSPTPRETPSGSAVDDAVSAYNQYATEQNSVPDNATFEYDPIEATFEEEDRSLTVTAAPATDSEGDRVMLTPTGTSESLSRTGAVLRSSWGTPANQELTTTDIYDQSVQFMGGDGATVAAATGVAQIPDRGESLLIVRAGDVEGLQQLAQTFDELTS